MPTLVTDPAPLEFEALLKRRRELGHDVADEVWDGVYHVNPAPAEGHAEIVQQLAELLGPLARAAGLIPRLSVFNLGEPSDYRVPDGALVRERGNRTYVPTAALILEVVSPNDQTWEKLGFYAAHHVQELVIVAPETRSVDWLGLSDGQYRPLAHSELIASDAAELAGRIDWPGPATSGC